MKVRDLQAEGVFIPKDAPLDAELTPTTSFCRVSARHDGYETLLTVTWIIEDIKPKDTKS